VDAPRHLSTPCASLTAAASLAFIRGRVFARDESIETWWDVPAHRWR
jgi:hypothetical protein